MSLLALLAGAAGTPPVTDPGAGQTNLYPAATPQAVPTPLAHWDFRESTAPFYTTTGDLPLAAQTTSPERVTSELGGALHFDGTQTLAIPPSDIGRLHIGGNGGTAVSVSAWVWLSLVNQIAIAGIWGEFADPPQRQYALFYDLPAYGGGKMSCFHVSKDGGPSPGYQFSTDYSANPLVAQTGRWHHFLGTYDGQQAVSYLDGIAYAYNTNYTRAEDGKRNPYTFNLGLNSSPHEFAVSTGGPMYGLLKDVKVWDTALTPGQALTLATEHEPTAPANLAPGITATMTSDKYTTDNSDSTGTYTFPGMHIGTAASDRLVVVAVHGAYNPPRTLISATIGGIPATLISHGGSVGMAYAVVPTGTAADVTVQWSGQTFNDQYCAAFVVEGTKKVHSSSGGVTGGRSVVLGGARGGLTLAFAALAAVTVDWPPFMTKLTEGRPEGSTSAIGSYSLATGAAAGWAHPVSARNGVGTAPRAIVAATFDPAGVE